MVSYFRNGFTYDRKAPNPRPLEALATLRETGRGHCQHFASAALVLLRAMEIPCRVGIGFLVHGWTDEGVCEVVGRNSHVWIEVPFEGQWIPFDPTPSEVLGAIPAQPNAPEPPPAPLTLEDVLGTDPEGRSSFSSLGLMIAGSISGLYALHFLTRRRRDRIPRDEAKLEETAYYERLVRLLTRRGFRKRPAQTPMEFANAVVCEDPELESLLPITEMFYRGRFSTTRFGEEEKARFEAFLRDPTAGHR